MRPTAWRPFLRMTMQFLMWAFVLIWYAGTCWASPALVSHSDGSCTGPCTAASNAMDTQSTPATLLVATCASLANTVGATVSDSQGNTWRHLNDYGSPAAGAVAIFYAYDKSGAPLSLSTTHTFSCSSTSYGAVVAQAFNGTLTGSDPYDAPNQNGASGQSQNPQPGGSGTPASRTPC